MPPAKQARPVLKGILVRLDLAGTALLARITRRSAQCLDIRPGREVMAQIKAVAVL